MEKILNERIHYDPDTGNLYWKTRDEQSQYVKAWNSRYAGRLITSKDTHGYITVSLDHKTYRGHRLIWLLMTGCNPTCDIDHINGKRDDNRWCNLRLATRSQNNFNRHAPSRSAYGRGVTLHKASGLFRAFLASKGKQRSLGYFKNLEDAQRAYREAAKVFHGEFYSGNGIDKHN